MTATGLRVSEALSLNAEDLTADGLVIRKTKFRKSRLVPLHPSAAAALDDYLRRCQPGVGEHLLITDSGDTLLYCQGIYPVSVRAACR